MSIVLENIILTAERLEEMVVFYDSVFEADLQPYEPFPDVRAFKGTLAGIEFIIVPNTLARVEAEQNRHQFQFIVDNVEEMLDSAIASGGLLLDEAGIRRGRIMGSVFDPDGNSIVFAEPHTEEE